MSHFILKRDLPLWYEARPWLDVRSNDEHTLYAYRIGQALLEVDKTADPAIVLPAIMLHDIGWKKLPEDKLTQAIGPSPKYPELVRIHEVEGAKIATEILERQTDISFNIQHITDIIDGHDTRPEAISNEDALMKDADKLWRYTRHGIIKMEGWFKKTHAEIHDILVDFVTPQLLSDAGRSLAQAYLASSEADLHLNALMALENDDD